jgi:hypothetical protein
VTKKDNFLNDKRQKALELIEEWLKAEETREADSNDETLKEAKNIIEHHSNNKMKEKKKDDPTSN